MKDNNFYMEYQRLIDSFEKVAGEFKVITTSKINLPLTYVPYADVLKNPVEIETMESINSSGENFFIAFTTIDNDNLKSNPKDKYMPIGVVCKLERIGEKSNNQLTYFCNPLYFAKIVGVSYDKGMDIAKVEPIKINEGSIESVTAMRDKAYEWYFNYLDYADLIDSKISVEITEFIKSTKDPNVMACLMMSTLDATQIDQYNFISHDNIEDRLVDLCTLLNRLYNVETVLKKVDDKIRQDSNAHQKEAYIKEKIKYLSKETGDSDDFENMEAKIKSCHMPKSVESYALEQLKKLEKTPPMAADFNVLSNYLDTITSLPWGQYTTDNTDINHAKEILDNEHYALDKVKTRILEYIAVLHLNQAVGGQILCLVGAPGVGKTSIAKSVANALGRKFVKLTLGGMHDESEIRGHRKTYVGAMVGKIVYNIKQAGSLNPVFLLDEIDKITTDIHGDPASALLEVLDPQQNSTFRDNFLEVPFDLSRVIFIATANYVENIPEPLKDRMEIINVDSYITDEKLEIAKRHLIPKQLKENGLEENSLKLSDDVLTTLIDEYTYEAGVRNLERLIAKICRQLAFKIVDNAQLKLPWIVTTKMLPTILNEPPAISHGVRKSSEVGVGYGLGWSPYGGSILTLEAISLKGKGNLVVTGNLKDVMQESCKIAYSVAKNKVEKLKSNIDYSKIDIHINACEGGIKKDGPSAGCVLALVIYSVLTHKKISNKFAMTGEISLTGQVYAIGGLREKLYACVQNNIENVIVPEENRKDITFIPSEIVDKLHIHYVSNFDQVVALAIGDKNEDNKK